MSKFEIEKSVPMPGISKDEIYPWSKMQIGDSSFIPNKSRKSLATHGATKKYGFKFVTRSIDGGVRVWRFA